MEQYVMVGVRESTKKMLMVDCKEEYLKHHPEMKEVQLTANKLIYEICKYYLEN